MRYLAEKDGELPSRGESTAATRPRTDTFPPNAILPTSPRGYLAADGIKRDDEWGDGVNVAEPPSDSRRAHSLDKVEPRPTGGGGGLSGKNRG